MNEAEKSAAEETQETAELPAGRPRKRLKMLLGAAMLLLAGALLLLVFSPGDEQKVFEPQESKEQRQKPVSQPTAESPPPDLDPFPEPDPPLPELDLDALHRPRQERVPEPVPLPELPPDTPRSTDQPDKGQADLPETPPRISSPGEAMQDLARYLLAHYRYQDDKGRLDLDLFALAERYAPRDLPPNMVYEVSPTAMRLAFMFTEKRFIEVLGQQAREELQPEAAAEFLHRVAEWLGGVAACPAALREDRPLLAMPLDILDCERSMKLLREYLAPGNREQVESTASGLLQQLAAGVGQEAGKVAAAAEESGF